MPSSPKPGLSNGGRDIPFQSLYFFCAYESKDGDKVVYSPADLRAYEPKLYELLGRVYPTSHHLPLDPFWNHKERCRPADKPSLPEK